MGNPVPDREESVKEGRLLAALAAGFFILHLGALTEIEN